MKLEQHKHITLASGSPRRKAYLEKFRLNFDVITGNVDELAKEGELPETYCNRMATEKAMSVFSNLNGKSVVIAADTIVVFEGQILGKPMSQSEVLPMLKRLNGQNHRVITSYHIRDGYQDKTVCRSISTDVLFNMLDDDWLESYANCSEPLDKAGAYSIQGIGTILVNSITGSYNNVVGLPIEVLLPDLAELGVISLK